MLDNYKNWIFKFVSLLKYKRQMTGNKLCVYLLRFAAQVYTICYGNPSCIWRLYFFFFFSPVWSNTRWTSVMTPVRSAANG